MTDSTIEAWEPTVGSVAFWVHCSDNYKSLVPCVVVEFTTRIKIAVRRPNNNISFRWVTRDEIQPHSSFTFLAMLECEAIRSRLVSSNRLPS